MARSTSKAKVKMTIMRPFLLLVTVGQNGFAKEADKLQEQDPDPNGHGQLGNPQGHAQRTCRHHVKVIGCIDHLGRCIAENDCKNHANDRDGHAQDFICLLRQMGNHHINMDMATPGPGLPPCLKKSRHEDAVGR